MKVQDSGFRLDGKVALVTGSAQGIGAAAAKRLGQAGVKVMVTDVLQELGQKVAEEIKLDGGEASFLKLDVSNEEEWQSVVHKTVELFGGLEVLVNNAGILPAALIETTSLELFRKIHAINTEGCFLGTKYGVLTMKPGGAVGRGGSIINISSAAGIIGNPGISAYCSSKGGVAQLTKSVALECAMLKYNIRVNSIHPGVVNTKLLADAIGEFIATGLSPSEEAAMTYFSILQPLGFLEPEDVSGAIQFLASDASRMVTGAEICVDGGYTAQ